MEQTDTLFRWSVQNSILMVFLTFSHLLNLLNLTVFSIFALLSYCILLYKGRKSWTPQGRFGLANTLTFMKLVILLLAIMLYDLTKLKVSLIGYILIGLVFLDKADGMVARFFKETSLFGEIFDGEVDAFATLIATLLLFHINAQYWWFLAVGVLRYLYVLVIWWFNPPVKKEEPRFLNRLLGVLMSFSYAFLIIFPRFEFVVLAAIASIAIIWSFGKDIYWVLGIANKSQ